jgi:hypothetical protein
MEKLLAMHVAAQLTQAACANAGGSTLPVDPELKNDLVRAKNLQVWETFRVFYRGVTGALADSTSWPSPSVEAGKLLPGLLQSLAPLVKDLPLGDLLTKLIAAIPAAPAARGPLPDPGAVRPAA